MRSIIFISALLSCGNLFAQGFYSRGALVSITPNTILSVPDSIVNEGTLINNGQIVISGAWINTGTYDAGTGQVDFDSDLDQVINHNAQSIEKLVISGGGKKEFLADIFVQSALTLTDGVLISENGARIVMEADVVVTGGSDDSHIQGTVERRGAGDWLYPIGDGTKYLPVTIEGVTDASAFGIVTLHEISNETLIVDGTLDEISNKRYFELASGGNIGSGVITLPTDDENLNGDLTVGAAANATGPYSDLEAAAPTFKYYAVATVGKDHPVQIYNAISPGSDGKNDYMTINNIEFYPRNRIIIVNRWGDQVFEMSGYDNGTKVFKGYSDKGNKLPAGTYFYALDLGDGSEKLTGHLVVK
jgi:gliding motility-associated-like protein